MSENTFGKNVNDNRTIVQHFHSRVVASNQHVTVTFTVTKIIDQTGSQATGIKTICDVKVFSKINKISSYEEDYRADRPMVQRASSETPSLSGNNRESSRMNLGIGYTAYQGGYNKLFTQVCVHCPINVFLFKFCHRTFLRTRGFTFKTCGFLFLRSIEQLNN